jgi:hypothetical protein
MRDDYDANDIALFFGTRTELIVFRLSSAREVWHLISKFSQDINCKTRVVVA